LNRRQQRHQRRPNMPGIFKSPSKAYLSRRSFSTKPDQSNLCFL
jgi:hypothetical protein